MTKTKRILTEYLGEDSCHYMRARYAVDEFRKIYGLLKSTRGIKLREITFG